MNERAKLFVVWLMLLRVVCWHLYRYLIVFVFWPRRPQP